MPTKTTTAKPRPKPSADHLSYQDMITDAIVTLKERNGSSRVALKKYIKANHKHVVDGKMFDSLFNRALKAGVEKRIFAQPKGASGGTKLAKKEPKPSTSKPVVKSVEGKTADKKATEKKPATTKKPVAIKKTAVRKTEAPVSSAKSKAANIKSKPLPKVKKSTKTSIVSATEVPAVLSRTKSGRVTKSTPVPKKAVASKKKTAVSNKKVTPKKTAA